MMIKLDSFETEAALELSKLRRSYNAKWDTNRELDSIENGFVGLLGEIAIAKLYKIPHWTAYLDAKHMNLLKKDPKVGDVGPFEIRSSRRNGSRLIIKEKDEVKLELPFIHCRVRAPTVVEMGIKSAPAKVVISGFLIGREAVEIGEQYQLTSDYGRCAIPFGYLKSSKLLQNEKLVSTVQARFRNPPYPGLKMHSIVKGLYDRWTSERIDASEY